MRLVSRSRHPPSRLLLSVQPIDVHAHAFEFCGPATAGLALVEHRQPGRRVESCNVQWRLVLQSGACLRLVDSLSDALLQGVWLRTALHIYFACEPGTNGTEYIVRKDSTCAYVITFYSVCPTSVNN